MRKRRVSFYYDTHLTVGHPVSATFSSDDLSVHAREQIHHGMNLFADNLVTRQREAPLEHIRNIQRTWVTHLRSPSSAALPAFLPGPHSCLARTKVTNSRSPILPVASGSMLSTTPLRCSRESSPGESIPRNISSTSGVLLEDSGKREGF